MHLKRQPIKFRVSTGVSIQSLLLIAVDRFGAVAFPLRSPLVRSKLCLFSISFTLIASTTIFSPHLFSDKLVEYPEKTSCEVRWREAFGEASSGPSYFLAISVVFFYMPIVWLPILYSIILIKLKRWIPPGEQPTSVKTQRAKRNRHVLRMAIAIVLGFVLCWVPFTVVTIVHLFAWHGRIPSHMFLTYVIALLVARENCAINPCISERYREELKQIFRCFCESGETL